MPRSGLPQVVKLTPHDYITNIQQRLGNRLWRAVSVLRLLRGPSAGTRGNLQPSRGHAEALRVRFTPWSAASNSRTLALPRNPGGSLLRSPGRLIFSLPLPVPGRSAALDVCVASSVAAAARGDAAQAAFDRKLSYDRTAATDYSLPPSYLDGGRTTAPSRERFSTQQTLPPVEPGSRCGNMRSKSLSCGGELPSLVQFCRILRCEQWLFVGIIDRALHHWGHVPPLDGEPSDHDHADFETGHSDTR